MNLDTLRGRRKGDPQASLHKCCGKNVNKCISTSVALTKACRTIKIPNMSNMNITKTNTNCFRRCQPQWIAPSNSLNLDFRRSRPTYTENSSFRPPPEIIIIIAICFYDVLRLINVKIVTGTFFL